jgi:hypothetical protein
MLVKGEYEVVMDREFVVQYHREVNGDSIGSKSQVTGKLLCQSL